MATDVNTGLVPNSDLALPGPAVTSTRSFRSSFLLPARQSSNSAGMNREVPGREKLDWTDSTPNLPTIRKQEETPVEKVMLKFGRTHEYFQGNTVFCAGGRLQNTRDRPVNLGTGSLVVLPSVLFFIFSAPWVWENISPALPIIYAYLLYICLSSFLHASGSNPGVSTHPTSSEVGMLTSYRSYRATYTDSLRQTSTLILCRWRPQQLTGCW